MKACNLFQQLWFQLMRSLMCVGCTNGYDNSYSTWLSQWPPDEDHPSGQSLHAPQALPHVRHSEHRWIKLPAANKEKVWLQFDKDLDQVLEATEKGDAD